MSDYVDNWQTETFDDGQIKVEHSFWGTWNDPENDGGYIRGVIKVVNTSGHTLENVQIFLDLDDDGATWDPYLCNSDGTKVPEGVVNLGNIPAAGEGADKYWWGLQHLFGPTAGNFTVRFNIMPAYTVKYSRSDAFVSSTTVDVSA